MAGTVLLGACIAAVFLTEGGVRIAAIVVAVLNAVSYLFAQPPVGAGVQSRRTMQIPTTLATAITVLTGVVGVGLLVYAAGGV